MSRKNQKKKGFKAPPFFSSDIKKRIKSKSKRIKRKMPQIKSALE